MAKKKQTAEAPPAADDQDKPAPLAVDGINSDELVALLNQKLGESESHWNKKFKLAATSKENEQLYYGEQISSQDDDTNPDLHLDNRIFSAIRTIVPHVTTRITQPVVQPSSLTATAKKFAEDMEAALFAKANAQETALKSKIKYALEDAIIRRRGYLKPRYNPATNDWFCIEYVPAESIIVAHTAKPYEEPPYFRHKLQKTVDDLLIMFPAEADKIRRLFNITSSSTLADYATEYEIFEDWKLHRIKNENTLLVAWHYKTEALGVVKDPNWLEGEDNFLPYHMMPLVSFNVLNDGRSWIDRSSYVEQAKYSQKTIDRRGEQIGKNAGLGSVGMAVVKSGALAEDQSQFLKYEEDVVLELDVPEDQSINDVFTKWQANSLSPQVYEDKAAAIEAVNNAFGASSINQGAESDNATLGQDILLRDESRGRQQDIVDAINNAMGRLYQLMAQFLLVYGDEQVLFHVAGENSEFDYLVMHTDALDTKAIIGVKEGTNMPIDRSQQRATADAAANQKMIDPLSYWEIMDEPNAQKRAKRLAEYTADPAKFMADVDEEVFNRFAYVDIEMVKRAQTPEYREELSKDYFDYLNKFALSGALDPENPNLAEETKQALKAFIDQQLQRGQRMLGMLETQLPTEQDVNAYNDQQNQQAQADAAQPKGASISNKPAQGAPAL
jgi:hypothetical protein